MATNDASNPAGQAAPELVEILRQLGAHRRAVHEQTYGNPPWTREQSDAYWYHPLVWACEWLEQRVGISRHDLKDAAIRLTTPQGLQGMDPLTGPGGRTTDAGQPDLLWMIPKFRELDRDGTTARLWKLLVEKYPAILANDQVHPPAADPGETLKVDLNCRTVTLNSVTYDVQSVQALRWLKVLAEHPGEWIAALALADHDPELQNVRTNELRDYLPVEAQALIESKTGAGSRLRAPA